MTTKRYFFHAGLWSAGLLLFLFAYRQFVISDFPMSYYSNYIIKIMVVWVAVVAAVWVIWFLFFTNQQRTTYRSVKTVNNGEQLQLECTRWIGQKKDTIMLTPVNAATVVTVAYDWELEKVMLEFWEGDPEPVLLNKMTVYTNQTATRLNKVQVDLLSQFKEARVSLKAELDSMTGKADWMRHITLPTWSSTVQEKQL